MGPPRDIAGECNARLLISDDYGDNYATMRCSLPPGHTGPHREDWRGGACRLEWEGDDRQLEDEATSVPCTGEAERSEGEERGASHDHREQEAKAKAGRLPAPHHTAAGVDGSISFEWWVGDDKVSLRIDPEEPTCVIRTPKDPRAQESEDEGPRVASRLLEWLVPLAEQRTDNPRPGLADILRGSAQRSVDQPFIDQQCSAKPRLPPRMHGRIVRMAADLRHQVQTNIAAGDEDRAREINLEALLVERCANELAAMLREEQCSETATPHHLWSNPFPPSNDPKLAEAKKQLESMVPLWVLIAYVWDRREQYKPSSASHEALCQIIGGLARLDHVEAWKHGELDDLRKHAENVIEKAPKVLLEKGGA